MSWKKKQVKEFEGINWNKSIFKKDKKYQFVLIFETNDYSHEPKTNPIEDRM